MSAKFVAYRYVPPGFEMVIEKKEVKAWNLWWNVQLTDDPESWDDEIKAINKMQDRLGELTDDQRLIRAQMAEFCRVSPLFPESVDILCEEIGTGRLTMPHELGCEGRNLMGYLGYHDEESMEKQRIHSLDEYARAMRRWLSREKAKSPIDAKVSGFLGKVTEPREVFVEGILSHLESGEFSLSLIKDMCEVECRKKGASLDTTARPVHCFKCSGGHMNENGLPDCSCSNGTLIDAGILCMRASDDWDSVVREYRRFVEEYILSYSLALNSWLEGSAAEPVTSLTPCRYVTEEIAKEIPSRVSASLGDKDDLKVWLVACLFKTLKSNQRWHKVSELIDGFPEATSWFQEISKGESD
jgi:hypothetical protein